MSRGSPCACCYIQASSTDYNTRRREALCFKPYLTGLRSCHCPISIQEFQARTFLLPYVHIRRFQAPEAEGRAQCLVDASDKWHFWSCRLSDRDQFQPEHLIQSRFQATLCLSDALLCFHCSNMFIRQVATACVPRNPENFDQVSMR